MRLIFAILLITLLAQFSQAEEKQLDFNRDVRPILSDKCYHCHGPDTATREADLRFDVESSAKDDRGGYVVIKPGDPDASELIARITTDDPELLMPPAGSERSLSAAERQTLVTWVQQGAQWQQHWAFVPPQQSELPTTDNQSWSRNAIDHFILKRLEDGGLQPSPETSRETWLRRVTFDLTGLPPTLGEVDEFLADQSSDAHEKVVDRLLASSRYGEHMAVSWLDAARYADTDGYQNDGPRTMFRWRDWVIDAYNANMPFDQFTVEQLAGDLIPDATLQQQIATGFNRNHRYNSEAGLIQEEFLLENAVDRVDTTSTVWMGLTMGCARCHDHKYDPFSQNEYYQLISFFDNVSESGRAVKFGNSEPWVIAPTEQQQAELDQLDKQLESAYSKQKELIDTGTAELKSLISQLAKSGRLKQLQDEQPVVAEGLTHHIHFEDLAAEGIKVESGKPLLVDGFRGKSAQVGGQDVFLLGKVGEVLCEARFSVAFWMKPENTQSGVVISKQINKLTRPGLAVEMHEGHLQFTIVTRWSSGAGTVLTLQKLEPGQWVHVALSNDGSQSTRGMQIWLDGQRAETTTLYNTNSNTGGAGKNVEMRVGGGVHGQKFSGQVDELRFYDRTLLEDEIGLIAEPASIVEIVAMGEADRSESMNKKLLAWMLEHDVPDSESDTRLQYFPKLVELRKQIMDLRYKRVHVVDNFPTSMVMEEWPTDKQTYLRVRGVYDQIGEPVSSNVPELFPTMDDRFPPNRLGYANWLVSGKHPLTARVTVNRFWQRYFGTGIVKTAEDFGQQGELPSHPELLDWLAVQFVQSGWDVKAMQKLIVLSATYRQSSRLDAALLERDAENRLLARGPRQRLSARILRDQALFVSGLLTPEIGGPSVSPYQPEKLWAEMSNMTYKLSEGKDLYRRGLYTLWKRTVAPPSLAILDAADRENCVVRPKRTNTPLQALTLLNEMTFVEAARNMAARVMTEGGDAGISYAFRLATSRQPSELEVERLSAAFDTYLKQFQAEPTRAEELLAIGQSPVPEGLDMPTLAANTVLCNVLLNLDEVLTKE